MLHNIVHVPSQITLTQQKINRAKQRYPARDIYLNINNAIVAFPNLLDRIFLICDNFSIGKQLNYSTLMRQA